MCYYRVRSGKILSVSYGTSIIRRPELQARDSTRLAGRFESQLDSELGLDWRETIA